MAKRSNATESDIAHWREMLTSAQGLTVHCVGGIPTSSGRTDYICVYGMVSDGLHPYVHDFSLTVRALLAASTGEHYRYNERRGAISVGGYGYSKTHHVAYALARILGIRVCYDGGHAIEPKDS